MDFEALFLSQTPLAKRKNLGQFFTPLTIAKVMANWISVINPKRVLEPAAGSGVLISQVLQTLPNSNITAVETDSDLVEILSDRFAHDKNVKICNSSFMDFSTDLQFDAVISNPPYIRHHQFEISDSQLESIQALGARIPKTSNSYVYFFLKSFSQLSEFGRGVYLIPSDWLNSNFGVFLKDYLVKTKSVPRIVLFRHELKAFDDNLSTALLLFVDRSHDSNKCLLIDVDENVSEEAMEALGNESLPSELNDRARFVDLDKISPKSKWLTYFDSKSQAFPDSWIDIGYFAKCSRGIATGANSFFHVKPSTLQNFNLDSRRAQKCIGRSRDVKGLVFSENDLEALEKEDSPLYLLNLNEAFEADAIYIEGGKTQNLPARFLLKQRQPWYKQEVRHPAPIWIGVFGRDGIRFIWNQTGIRNLTTFHCLYPECDLEDIPSLVALLNSSPLQELNKASERAYGAGLRKVEPRDLHQMRVPDIRTLSTKVKESLSNALLESDSLRRAESVEWRLPLNAVVEGLLKSTSRSIN